MSEVFKVTRKGAGFGEFLSPPGHPGYAYGVIGYSSNRSNAREIASMSLESAINTEWVPENVKAQARTMLANATLVASEAWLNQVYAYFHNCYAPESGSRDVSESVSDPTNALPATRHLGYLHVREYFPDHEPRTDLILGADGYGARPCVRCSQSVQYEASIDGWAPFNGPALCTDGQPHAVAATVAP